MVLASSRSPLVRVALQLLRKSSGAFTCVRSHTIEFAPQGNFSNNFRAPRKGDHKSCRNDELRRRRRKVADEVKDEEKQIDVTGVEVALALRRTTRRRAPPPPLDEPAPVDEPAATPFDEETRPRHKQSTSDDRSRRTLRRGGRRGGAGADEPTTPTNPIPQLTEVPTPCRRDSEIARELHEADAARARELDEARRRDEELAARLAADDERERDAARKRDEELAAQLLEDDEREARAAAAQRELDDAAAAARLASEMADAERALERRAESDAAVARRLASEVPLRRGSSDEAYARAVALALEDEDEEDEARERDDALLARALQHEEAHDAERAPRRRGDADLDLALAMTLDEEGRAPRRLRSGGLGRRGAARALQSQEDDRHQAFAFDDEALARRLEEEANLECVRRLAARDERDDARLAFELERQQHEAMKRAEDDFSVAARVQRELTAREEDEKAAARRRELEPPSRLTRPAEAPVKENRKQRRERMLLEEAREIEKRAAMSLGRDPSLDELADQAARDQAAGAATTSRTSAAHAIAAQSGGDVFGNIDYALGRAADAERRGGPHVRPAARAAGAGVAPAGRLQQAARRRAPPARGEAGRPRGRAVLRGEQRPHPRRGARRRAGAKFRIGGRAERGVDKLTRGLFERRARPGRPALADAARRHVRRRRGPGRAAARGVAQRPGPLLPGRPGPPLGRRAAGPPRRRLRLPREDARSSLRAREGLDHVHVGTARGGTGIRRARGLVKFVGCPVFLRLGKLLKLDWLRDGVAGNAQPATVGVP